MCVCRFLMLLLQKIQWTLPTVQYNLTSTWIWFIMRLLLVYSCFTASGQSSFFPLCINLTKLIQDWSFMNSTFANQFYFYRPLAEYFTSLSDMRVGVLSSVSTFNHERVHVIFWAKRCPQSKCNWTNNNLHWCHQPSKWSPDGTQHYNWQHVNKKLLCNNPPRSVLQIHLSWTCLSIWVCGASQNFTSTL